MRFVTGKVYNGYIQIVQGVKSSDNVVMTPPKNLSDKMKVKVVDFINEKL